MQRAKICHITSVHPPFDTRIFHKECRSLARMGYDVTLIVPHERDEVRDGVRIKAVPKPAGRIVRMTRTVWHVYWKAVRLDAYVYHFHDPELILVGLLLRSRGKKVIYDVHEYYGEKIRSKHYIPPLLRRPVAKSFDLFESFACRFFDGIIVADRVTEAKFSGRAIRVGNFPYLPRAVDRVKKFNEFFAVVYVGGLSENQGLFKMVNAMEFVQGSAKLILVGEFMSQALREKAEAMKGYEKVEWVGHKPWPEAMKIVASSHVGLALYQPVPAYLYAGENSLKLFEYMMFGLPVLASNFPNLADIVKSEACGIVVDPTDPRTIAQEINSLMENSDLLREMGQRGAEAFAEKYNWELSSKELLKLYDKM